MAVGDLYKVSINCSTNNRGWSFGAWVQESSPITPADDAAVIARAVLGRIELQLQAVLTLSSWIESVQAWRRFPGPSLPGFVKKIGGRGTVVGTDMSNDNSLFINLRQSAQDARFNGGVNLAGQTDANHAGNVWDAAYLAGAVQSFANTLVGLFSAEIGDSGTFEWVVVSEAFTPPQNSIGTPFDVTAAVPADRVLTQRRRRQKSAGFTNA